MYKPLISTDPKFMIAKVITDLICSLKILLQYYLHQYIAIHPTVVEIFQSGAVGVLTSWQTKIKEVQVEWQNT